MCETWSLLSKEEHGLGCLRTKPRRIFRMKRAEITGGWKRLHNKKLHDLYALPDVIRIIK
jgi:hypothetical protein